MIGNVLRFRVKRTLVGIAALSLLVPIASHADVTPGRWIFDGFSRATRDGRGSTCVGSGGDTHAFEAPSCNSAASELKATVETTAKARKAAQDAAAAKRAAAAAEAKEFLPGGQNDFRVRRSDGIKIVDGFGRDCVKNGSIISSTTADCADPTPQSARGVDSIIAARKSAEKEAHAFQAAAAAAATALPETPGGALADGEKGAYIYRPAGSNVRDGYGRSCVKDGLWHPAFATEECDPDLYNQWAAKSAKPEPDLLKRIEMPPPEVQRAADTTPANESAPAPASAAPAPVVDTAPAVFPITTYSIDDADDATLPTVAALAGAETDDGDEDEEVIADSDEAIDDGDDAPPVFAAETDDDITDSEAMVAADDDEDEDEDALPDDPEEEDDDTMPFLAGDMRDEDDSVLALDDEEGLDGDDDALLDEDDAPAAAFMTAGGDEDEDEDNIVAADDVDDDTETAYLGDGDAAEADDAPMLAMVADDDDDNDDAVFATEDEDDDTETAYLGDGDVAEADEAPIAAMVADDDDDAVFATDDDDDAPPVFAEEPAAAEPTPAMVVAETAPEVTSAPVAVQPDDKQVEFPVTRYEFDSAAEVPPEPTAVVAPVVNAECPPTTIQMEEGRFAFDRFNLRPEVISKLDAIADLLKTAKCDAILITGHTDRIGTSKYNQRLSERRAAAAKSYLVDRKGIDPALISVVGVGKSQPVTTVADCKGKRKKALIACYAPDRRVVITATVRKPAN